MAAVIKTVAAMLRMRIISGAIDDTAVIFYNTRASNSANKIDATYTLAELEPPKVERILELDQYSGMHCACRSLFSVVAQRLATMTADEWFEETVGCGKSDQHSRSMALSNALWEARVTLTQQKVKASRKVMICTVDASPALMIEG
jgi:Ku70/Ku80 N-terminal alpha/beta domain